MRRLPHLSILVLRSGNGNRVAALVHATRFRIHGICTSALLPFVTDQSQSVHY